MDTVKCFECGRDIPAREAPTCRACQRQQLIVEQNSKVLTELYAQTSLQRSIKTSVFFLAFVVFLSIVITAINLMVAASNSSRSPTSSAVTSMTVTATGNLP